MTTPQQIIERLYQIKENPGIYKSLSAEEQADILLFILTPKPLFKKTATVKVEKGERGERGERGIDGTNSLTEAQQTAILADLVGKIKVKNGKDAVVTTAMLEGIVAEVISRIELPDLEQVVTTTITADPTAIRNSLELLNDEERLKQSAIDNLPEDLQKIRDAIVALPRAGGGIGKNQVYNFIREAIADGTISAGGGAAGADTQVQFNDNGALGASPDMTYDGDKLEIKATDFNQNNSTIKVVDFNGNLMMDLRNNGTVNFGNFQFLNAANRFIFDGLIVFQKSGAGLYFGPAGTLLSFQGSNARLVLRGYGVTINRGIATANAALDVQSVRTSQPVSIFALASGQLTDLAQWNNFAGAILAKIDATGKIQASGYKSSDDSEGVTTTFLNGDGNTVTVKNGLITNIS